ncbi:MAG: ABC transporter substrate-binding protein [Jannaschia helgolandensis]|uniref:Putative thiamine transport system substrate-binding protein n=1 Tax=Jannaschia helgolandensis TaxID=188906 RepID=A0A1H7PJN4_9RHOB|nr:ABC transporter substrate-binding protein [Jannaschia helgolandensis]SEL35654.1 putative thiamine transport system substrate-binding protein [Jannaschia helgolandensis]
MRFPTFLTAPLIAALAFASPAAMANPDVSDWDAVSQAAQGQTVYWYAWGGSTATNDFIAWIGDRAEQQGVRLEHVKLSDTADAVGAVLTELQAGRETGGSVDLIWINGANFASMKSVGLLFGPFAEQLPNWQYVDVDGKTVTSDFTVPTEGYESPWAMAQLVFVYDSARVPEPPKNAARLLQWAQENPGRFTYPQPPDFLGTTFLKQMLIELVPDPAVLQDPVDEDYEDVTAILWDYLDQLTPYLWRQGRAYPETGPRQLQLINDGETDIAFSFSPGEATTAIANFDLPETVRTYVLDGGTLGNASFVAIPFNSSSKEGAMVVANILLSPEAQLRAQTPGILGYGTVLDMDRIPEADRAAFEALDLGIATLSPAELGQALPEPHPSWATRLADDWVARYGVAE